MVKYKTKLSVNLDACNMHDISLFKYESYKLSYSLHKYTRDNLIAMENAIDLCPYVHNLEKYISFQRVYTVSGKLYSKLCAMNGILNHSYD